MCIFFKYILGSPISAIIIQIIPLHRKWATKPGECKKENNQKELLSNLNPHECKFLCKLCGMEKGAAYSFSSRNIT